MTDTNEHNKSVWAVVYDQYGSYLLLRRAPGKKNQLEYNFPGGKINEGESAKIAAARELKEEAGITTAKLVHDIDINSKSKTRNYFSACYTYRPKVIMNNESDDVLWCNLKNANKLDLHGPTKLYVRHMFSLNPRIKTEWEPSIQTLYFSGLLGEDIVMSASVSLLSGKLSNVRVESKYRSLGYAKKLLSHILTNANPTNLLIESGKNPNYEGLIKLYSNYGFKVKNRNAGKNIEMWRSP